MKKISFWGMLILIASLTSCKKDEASNNNVVVTDDPTKSPYIGTWICVSMSNFPDTYIDTLIFDQIHFTRHALVKTTKINTVWDHWHISGSKLTFGWDNEPVDGWYSLIQVPTGNPSKFTIDINSGHFTYQKIK